MASGIISPMIKKISLGRFLWISAGLTLVVLGTIGIFLPLLPTTILYILAAGAFAKSSDRLHHWIMDHPIIGRMIRNYRLYHAIDLRTKLVSIATLWLTIGASAIFAVQNWWVRGLLGLIAFGVTWHLLALKTLTPQMAAEIARREAEENSSRGQDSTASSALHAQ